MRNLNWLELHLPKWVWDNLALASLIGLCAVLSAGFYLTVHNNNQRINEIQQSRITSCQKTYRAFLEVFAPFFPPPAKRTQKQNRDWRKLVGVTDRLAAQCGRQTIP